MRPPRRRRSWFEDWGRRHRIEQAARDAYPDLTYQRQQRRDGAFHVYSAELEVPGYEPCRVSLEFSERAPNDAWVFASGPSNSPHRFATRSGRHLCIWFPSDTPERRWLPDDGLLALFGMVQVHLFKENYWRETGQWVGDEAPHGDGASGRPDAAPKKRTETA